MLLRSSGSGTCSRMLRAAQWIPHPRGCMKAWRSRWTPVLWTAAMWARSPLSPSVAKPPRRVQLKSCRVCSPVRSRVRVSDRSLAAMATVLHKFQHRLMRCHSWMVCTGSGPGGATTDPFGVGLVASVVMGQSPPKMPEGPTLVTIAPSVACFCVQRSTVDPNPILSWIFECLCTGDHAVSVHQLPF